jgi:hypothetical protein
MRSFAIGLALLGGCGGARAPIGVTVVLEGAPAASPAVREVLAEPLDPSVELRVAGVPTAGGAVDPAAVDLDRRLAAARRAYVETLEFDACAESLADAGLVTGALARGDRTAAARTIALLTACRLAGGDADGASRAAAQLGVLGLAVPDEAASMSPRAEQLLAQAVVDASSLERAELQIETEPAGAAVRVDGRDTTCRSPCSVELARGEHVVAASLDGREDAHALADAPRDAPLAIALAPAQPDVAAAQWRARYAAEIESAGSLRLLQTAVRDRRVLLVVGTGDGSSLRLRAALAVDDAQPLHVERVVRADAPEDARGLLRDILSSGGIIPPRSIAEEPLFWIALVGGAALAAGITAGLLYEPEVLTPIVVRGAR